MKPNIALLLVILAFVILWQFVSCENKDQENDYYQKIMSRLKNSLQRFFDDEVPPKEDAEIAKAGVVEDVKSKNFYRRDSRTDFDTNRGGNSGDVSYLHQAPGGAYAAQHSENLHGGPLPGDVNREGPVIGGAMGGPMEYEDKSFHSKMKNKIYYNQWVVHITGGIELARRVTKELGYKLNGLVPGFEDMYTVSHLFEHHNSKREAVEITEHMLSHAKVFWAEQQYKLIRVKRAEPSYWQQNDDYSVHKPLIRVKRKFEDEHRTRTLNVIGDSDSRKLIDSSSSEFKQVNAIDASDEATRDKDDEVIDNDKKLNEFDLEDKKQLDFKYNDDLWPDQWYLHDTRSKENLPRLDLRVVPVWEKGFTGEGIKIVLIDDGLEWMHSDIIKNYDPDISYDFNSDDHDPQPRYDVSDSNSHGTKCAGEIVMEPDNGKCGVGVAHGAKIGGIRLLDGPITDLTEGLALQKFFTKADIYSSSWGPSDTGTVVEGPGRLSHYAIQKSIREGRDGKGVIFVWASGNGGSHADSCSCDGYASSLYSLSVSSASERGEKTWYGEKCTSTITSTYSSGAYTDQKISTTTLHNDCTGHFSGTSAAAPLAAGIVALTLQANPSMTWRDIQHCVVVTSNPLPLGFNPNMNSDSDSSNETIDSDWTVNAKGLAFNPSFGFGLMDAAAMVERAETWINVPIQNNCSIAVVISSDAFQLRSGSHLEIEIETDCELESRIESLEQVQLVTSLRHTKRGQLRIVLTSPQGTSAIVLPNRIQDDSTEGFHRWPLTSVQTWGENPNGIWRVEIWDVSASGESGEVEELTLVLYGTESMPKHLTNDRQY